MAVLDFDGFDHYTNTTTKLDTLSTTKFLPASDVVAGNNEASTFPVLGTLGMTFHHRVHGGIGQATSGGIKFPFVATSGVTVGIGFHFYTDILPNVANWCPFTFGTAVSTDTKYLRMTNGGVLHWCTGTSPDTATSLGNTGANVFNASTLYHIEMKILFHASAGTIELRVNGAVWMSLSGIDTLPVSSNYMLFARSNGNLAADTAKMYVDNFYVWDTTGSINNNFLGERNVVTLLPNADTATATWTKSTGVNGYALIDNVPPVSGTDYLESSATNDASVFELTTLSNPNTVIKAVQTYVFAEKTQNGPGEIRFGPRAAGVDDLSATTVLTQSQYLYFTKVSELNPATGLAWAVSDIAALQTKILRSA